MSAFPTHVPLKYLGVLYPQEPQYSLWDISVFLLKNGLPSWCTSTFPEKILLHHSAHIVLVCVSSPPCNAPSAGNLWQTLLKASIITAGPSYLNYSLESHTFLPGPPKGLSVSHRTAPPLPRDNAAHSTNLKYLSAPKVSERSPPLRWLGLFFYTPAHFTQIPPPSPLETSHKRVLWILNTRILSNSVCGTAKWMPVEVPPHILPYCTSEACWNICTKHSQESTVASKINSKTCLHPL